MDLEIEPETALYSIAAFLGAITVIYFGSSLIFDLSPVTKSLAFFASFVVFLSVSMYLSGKKKTHSIISLGMTGISYLAFLYYTLGKFEVPEEGVFASLFFSSLLFVVLGYLISEKRINLDKKRLKHIVYASILIIASIILFDVASPQPSYNMEFNEQVVIEPRQETVLGSLTVRNDFLWSRELEEPSYGSCMNLNSSRDHIAERRFYTGLDMDDMIAGLDKKSYNLTVEIHQTEQLNQSRNMSVEQVEDCPEERANDKLYVFEESDSRRTVGYID